MNTEPANNNYRFQVGDIVDHLMGGMISTVLCRSTTAAGIEVYGLFEHAGEPGNMRVMRGPYIERVKRSRAKA